MLLLFFRGPGGGLMFESSSRQPMNPIISTKYCNQQYPMQLYYICCNELAIGLGVDGVVWGGAGGGMMAY